MSSSQLPLALRFASEPRLGDFVPADAPVVAVLQAWAAGSAPQDVFIAGPAGSGKTHLLLATAAAAGSHSLAYLPMRRLAEHAAAAIDAQGVVDLLLVDELESIAGNAAAEHALFALYNRQFDAGGRMLFAAREFPDGLGLQLPDLASRLSRCLRFSLTSLNDAQRRDWLAQRAAALGLSLDDAVIDWLFRRVGRDLPGLAALLERLDRESLAEQRRVTVPFLRRVLDKD